MHNPNIFAAQPLSLQVTAEVQENKQTLPGKDDKQLGTLRVMSAADSARILQAKHREPQYSRFFFKGWGQGSDLFQDAIPALQPLLFCHELTQLGCHVADLGIRQPAHKSEMTNVLSHKPG
jgi:hypothetical protein